MFMAADEKRRIKEEKKRALRQAKSDAKTKKKIKVSDVDTKQPSIFDAFRHGQE